MDWALAAICAFIVYGIMAKGWTRHEFPMSLWPVGPWAAPLLALLVAVPVALRRRDPVGAFLLALVGCALIITAGGQITRGAFLPLALVLFMVAATRTRTVAVASLAACLVLLVVQGFVLSMMGNGSGPATGVALILIIAWMVGISAQQRRAYTARTREQVATAAVTEERLRIARELHDVVAHSMTVVAVQAGFGEYVFDNDPAQARAALGNIQHVTREALSDMQRLLGVLRQDGTGQPGPAAPDEDQPAAPARRLQLAPAPGLADLERLVSTTAGAGVRVALTRTGDRRDIPAAIDQSAFRIVQEALTNVVKHSGAGACQVIVGYEPDGLTVEITDPGQGQGPRDEVAGTAGHRGAPGGRSLGLGNCGHPGAARRPRGRHRARHSRHARAGEPVRRRVHRRATARAGLRGDSPLPAARTAAAPGGEGRGGNHRGGAPRACRAARTSAVSLRVVVADDQALVRAGFCGIVAATPGLDVVGEAGTGADAVEVTRRTRPDVVLMDVRMPELDGIEATRQITGSPGLASHVLILTTFDLDEYVYSALHAGASGFLLKSTEPAELVNAIRVVAAGDALLAPSVTRRLVEEFTRRPAPVTRPFTPEPPPAARLPAVSLDAITGREREVLALIATGLSNSEIAAQLSISEATAKTHVGHLLTKLSARDRVHLVILAFQAGLVQC